MIATDRAERKWDKIVRDHKSGGGKGGLRGTSRRGTSGRSGEDIRYNTAYRFFYGDELGGESHIDPDGYWRDEIKAVKGCMKKKLMGGSSITSAFVGCGMDYDKGGTGKKADIPGRGGSRRYYGANFANMNDPDLYFARSGRRESKSSEYAGMSHEDYLVSRMSGLQKKIYEKKKK